MNKKQLLAMVLVTLGVTVLLTFTNPLRMGCVTQYVNPWQLFFACTVRKGFWYGTIALGLLIAVLHGPKLFRKK